MAFKYQFETILNLKTRMEEMKKSELKIALARLEKEKNKLENLKKDKEKEYNNCHCFSGCVVCPYH